MLLLLVSLARAATPNAGPPLDLDGDGRPDPISIGPQEVRVGRSRVDCGDLSDCEVEVHDLSSADTVRELALCDHGPRDERSCHLYRLVDGGLVELKILLAGSDPEWGSPPTTMTTKGNGILLADYEGRWYTRREKLVLEGGTLRHVPQPAYLANLEVPVDRGFALTRQPGGGELVANVAAGTRVTALVESGDKAEWFLVQTSTGLLGWASLEQLIQCSDEMMLRNGAG